MIRPVRSGFPVFPYQFLNAEGFTGFLTSPLLFPFHFLLYELKERKKLQHFLSEKPENQDPGSGPDHRTGSPDPDRRTGSPDPDRRTGRITNNIASHEENRRVEFNKCSIKIFNNSLCISSKKSQFKDRDDRFFHPFKIFIDSKLSEPDISTFK
jgi:hypothetical protein